MTPQLENWERGVDECTPALWYQQHYGHRLVLVHLDHLTGIGFIDEPIHQVVQLLCYGYSP